MCAPRMTDMQHGVPCGADPMLAFQASVPVRGGSVGIRPRAELCSSPHQQTRAAKLHGGGGERAWRGKFPPFSQGMSFTVSPGHKSGKAPLDFKGLQAKPSLKCVLYFPALEFIVSLKKIRLREMQSFAKGRDIPSSDSRAVSF